MIIALRRGQRGSLPGVCSSNYYALLSSLVYQVGRSTQEAKRNQITEQMSVM